MSERSLRRKRSKSGEVAADVRYKSRLGGGDEEQAGLVSCEVMAACTAERRRAGLTAPVLLSSHDASRKWHVKPSRVRVRAAKVVFTFENGDNAVMLTSKINGVEPVIAWVDQSA